MSVARFDRRERRRRAEQAPPVPHSIELERRLIASLLSPWSSIDTAAPIVTSGFRPEFLFREDYRPIARECLSLLAEGVKPSTLLVSRRMSASELDTVRGHAGLEHITDGVPPYTPDQLSAMVADVADLAWRRTQIDRVDDYRTRLYDEDTDVERLRVEPDTWQEHGIRSTTPALLNDVSIIDTPDTPQVIRGIFPANSLGLIAAPTGAGKSHLALSSAIAVTLKTPWFGRFEIDTPGQVLCVLGEGAGGVKSRIIAGKESYGCPLDFPLGILLHLDAFSLQSDVDVSALLRRIPGDVELRLIYLDTWARLLLPGDENSQRDAGIGIAAMDKIRRATGATVVALHHLNATGERERGSTALKAAVDTAIRIVPQSQGIRRVVCDKSRDAEPFAPFHFSLMPVGPSVVPMWAEMADEHTTVEDDVLAQARRLVVARPTASANALARDMHCTRQKALKAIQHARTEQMGEA